MTRSWMMLCLAAAIGCAPTVSKEPPITSSAATLALFEPDSTDACLSVLPFPTDLAKNPQTGRLDLPYCKTDSPEQLGMKSGLRTLDGYSASVTLTTRFSGAINADTVLGGFKLIEAGTGRVVPFTHSFVAAAGNTLYVRPQEVLAEYTTYVAVLTGAVTDTAGKPVVSDQIFTFAKSRESLVDDTKHSRFAVLDDASANALEPLRQAYSAVFELLESAGLKREEIAVAWWFTTQSAAGQLVQLGPMLTAHAPTVVHENAIAASEHALVKAALPVALRDQLCEVHTGRVDLKSLLSASGTFDPALTPTVVPTDYILITPNLDGAGSEEHPKCSTPWPGDKLAVFAHGLGRCKNDVLALANAFAKARFAVLALDGPRAGARSVVDRGDQDLDGCPDQPATPELIALPGQNPNPFAIRDHLREWALELAQVAVAAKQAPLAFVGQSGTATAKLALVGHSWGGMAAALTSIIPQVPFDAVIANAASADLGGVFAPLLVDPEVIAAFRWAMEAADPLFAGRVWAKTAKPFMLIQIVAQPGANQPPLHGTDTQRLLRTAFGNEVKASEFVMVDEAGAANTPLCDDPTGVVGALLKPCAASDAGRAAQATGKFAGLQRQVVNFAATALAGAPVVCDPNPTVTCP